MELSADYLVSPIIGQLESITLESYLGMYRNNFTSDASVSSL